MTSRSYTCVRVSVCVRMCWSYRSIVLWPFACRMSSFPKRDSFLPDPYSYFSLLFLPWRSSFRCSVPNPQLSLVYALLAGQHVLYGILMHDAGNPLTSAWLSASLTEALHSDIYYTYFGAGSRILRIKHTPRMTFHVSHLKHYKKRGPPTLKPLFPCIRESR